MLTTVHTQRYAAWHNDVCRDLGSTWAKIVNPSEGTPIFPDVPRLDVRFHESESWQWDTYIRHGYDGGRAHIRDLAPRFRKIVHSGKALETANEPPCANGTQLAALNSYWLGAMDEADAQGFPIIIGHIPEGNPAADQGLEGVAARASETWKLEQLAPAVRACAQRGHILGWHAYWHPHVEGPDGRWHALGRVQWTIQQFLSMGIGRDDLQVLVTEFGIDGLILQRTEGWRVLSNPDAYRAGIVEAEAFARTVLQIVGLCYFTFGWERPWESYDHDEAFARSLIAPLQALGATTPTTPSAPAPAGIDWARVEAAMGAEAQKTIVPLNDKSAFEKAAISLGLIPANNEYDMVIDGVTFRGQAYRQAGERDWQYHVAAVKGHWDKLHWWKRQN